jgi:hypothetical protein
MGYCPIMQPVYNPRNRNMPSEPEYVGQCSSDMCEFWDREAFRCSLVSIATALGAIALRLGDGKAPAPPPRKTPDHY